MPFSDSPVVRLQQACVVQEERIILQDLNLELGKGEFAYLIGRTGSGKSSLLRTLYADLPLRAGSGEVAGFRLETIKPRDVPYLRRRVGIIFQDFQLFADRTVADNLLFVLRATGWRDSGKMKKRLAEVLMRVGLGLAGNRFPHQLSGGEQQRVVIARALLNEPLILFADEPTGNLDPEVAEGILQLFTEINRSGTAVLMATHNYELLQRHPSRIFKCEGNRLLDSRQEALALSGE